MTNSDTTKAKLDFFKNGVAQIALIVKDIDKTVEHYWNFFGIGPWHFYTYGKPLVKKMSYKGKDVDYRMRVALSWIGPLRIELIQPVEGDTVYKDFVEEHGYGIHHFGLLVENMRDAIAKAETAGLSMTQDGSGFGADNDGHYAYLDTESLIGTTIELIERPKGRLEPEKIYPPHQTIRLQ